MNNCYNLAHEFMRKYPKTMAWRIKSHASVVDKHLGRDEEILYVIPGQYNDNFAEIFNTYLLAFTNQRIILAKKRILFGYFFISIRPEMYNDITVNKGIFWGRVIIDTIKEVVTMTNIDANALPEIDSKINEIVARQQKEMKKEDTE